MTQESFSLICFINWPCVNNVLLNSLLPHDAVLKSLHHKYYLRLVIKWTLVRRFSIIHRTVVSMSWKNKSIFYECTICHTLICCWGNFFYQAMWIIIRLFGITNFKINFIWFFSETIHSIYLLLIWWLAMNLYDFEVAQPYIKEYDIFFLRKLLALLIIQIVIFFTLST